MTRLLAMLLPFAGCVASEEGKGTPAETVTDSGAAEDVGCVGLDMDGDGVCDRLVADWSAGATLEPGQDRANIYQLTPQDLAVAREAGLRHAMGWPVASTRMLLPYDALMHVFTDPDSETLRQGMDLVVGFSTEETMYARMGLATYPSEEADPSTAYWAPPPEGLGPGDAVGAVRVETERGTGLTFGCGVCHAGSLFGRVVVGLPNKQPRPNELFHLSRQVLSGMDGPTFQGLTGATDGEVEMFLETIDALQAVGTREPVALGLDTSLAQVAGSLARRQTDGMASFDEALEQSPRPLAIDGLQADSKPMPWWTLKHKTRWLSDGSIVEGNPILTNFLWNELGRGADLVTLEDWLESPTGQTVVDELTVAVFAAPAPRWTDFFPAETIDESLAMEGQQLFAERCTRCHGTYEKGWDADDSGARDAVARLETTAVLYHAQTPRIDVGTHEERALGMADLEPLNELDISIWMQTTVDASEPGYVPPPLDGIWARWPYFHDNSAPTLCDVLRPPAERPLEWVQGPADEPEAHFDADCVGYPVGEAIPEDWWADEEARVDLSDRPPQGHDEMLDGVGEAERRALVEFLKTL